MYDIFISYNWNVKKQVKLLHEILENLNYKVWRDEIGLNAVNNSLTAELANAIKTSKIFFK